MAMVLAIVLAGAAMISGQETGAGSGVAAKIRELEYARFVAQDHKDRTTLDAILDHALVWVDPDGVQLSKADYLARLRSAGTNVRETRPVTAAMDRAGPRRLASDRSRAGWSRCAAQAA